MEIYLLGQWQLVPIFVSVVGRSGRNTEWVFWVLFKNLSIFLHTGLQGWSCVCTILPCFLNPGEVLEAVTFGSRREVPKSSSAHGILQESLPGPWTLGVSWVELEMSLIAECKTAVILLRGEAERGKHCCGRGQS